MSIFFRKIEGREPQFSAVDISERLVASENLSDPTFLSFISQLFPADDYFVRVLHFTPQLVYPGDKYDYFTSECPALFGIDPYKAVPHNPMTPYYRDSGQTFRSGKLLINFVIPLQQPHSLNPERVLYYEERLRKGCKSTALSLSVLDIRGPAVRVQGTASDLDEHWCLAHYLIDGHHKIHAAAQSGKECSLLCFVSRKESFGGEDALYTLSECT